MNPKPLTLLAAAMASAGMLFNTSCSKNDGSTTTVESTKTDGATTTVVISDSGVATGFSGAWDHIKDFAYDRRADFSAGVDRISGEMDSKAEAIRSRSGGLSDAASADRDKALKEYDDARASLKADSADLSAATAEKWSDAKAKASGSLLKAKAAFDKLTKANPTS